MVISPLQNFQAKQCKHQIQAQSENSELYSETQRLRKQLKNSQERHKQLENMKSSDSDCCPEREPHPNDFPLIPNALLAAGNTGGEKQCALVSKHLNIVGSGKLQVIDSYKKRNMA